MIHGSHASVTIYYAKLPNNYLVNIAQHGVKYLQQCHPRQPIKLHRTKIFHVRNPVERVQLFKILVKLLWYLVSGKSHVGHLYNHTRNPLHILVRAITISSLMIRAK